MWCGVEGEGVACEGGLGREVVFFPLLFPSGVTPSPLSLSLHCHSLPLVDRRCCHTTCDVVAWWGMEVWRVRGGEEW